MKRKLFTSLSAVSLLLCVAVSVLWVRSLSRVDIIDYTVFDYSIGLGSSGTQLKLVVLRSPAGLTASEWELLCTRAGTASGTAFGADEGEINFGRYLGMASWARFWVPHWSALLALAAVTWCSIRFRGERGIVVSNHSCPNCAYDLRATPDRCPECGTARAAG